MSRMPRIGNIFSPAAYEQGFSVSRNRALQDQQHQQNLSLGDLLSRGMTKEASNNAYKMGRINDGIMLAGGNKKDTPTALMKNLEAGGLVPGTKEYRDAILSGTNRGMVINNQLPGSEKGTNKLTEKLAEQAAGVFDQAASAQDLASKYEQINEYAQDPNVRTGTFGAVELSIKKLGNTVFGLDFDGLPEAEQIQKVGDLLVGDIRKLQGDTRMSDADRRAYRAIPPNIGDSKQGILLATEIMRKTSHGLAERQRVLSDLISKNGGRFDAKIWSQYNQYINTNPILTREDIMKARKIAKTAKQSLPGAGMKKSYEQWLKE